MISQEELELRNSLSHHGILGMKWGIRRFQNSDGSLTSAGKRRQEVIDSSRKEGITYAKNLKSQQKKGEDVASALITAQKKAKTGQVDKSFLDNKNISQKAKDKVLATANKKQKQLEYEHGKAEAEKKARQESLAQIERKLQTNNYKVSKDFVNKFLENYDDIDMLDLYTPEELAYWD